MAKIPSPEVIILVLSLVFFSDLHVVMSIQERYPECIHRKALTGVVEGDFPLLLRLAGMSNHYGFERFVSENVP